MASSTANRNAKAMAAAMLSLLGASLSAILFVMYQMLVGGGEAPSAAPGRAFTIPANAVQFGSLGDFEKALLKPGVPFALTISEAEMNQRITAALSKQPDAPVRDVVGRLGNEQADFDGKVRAGGVDLSPTITMRFWAERGALLYEITGINLGPIPVPSMARQAISDTVGRQLDTQKLTEKYQIDDVQVRPGFVTLVGRPK